jgi:hypothetical protein
MTPFRPSCEPWDTIPARTDLNTPSETRTCSSARAAASAASAAAQLVGAQVDHGQARRKRLTTLHFFSLEGCELRQEGV